MANRRRSRAVITNDSVRMLYLPLPCDAYLLAFLPHYQYCYTHQQALPPNDASYLAPHVSAHSPRSSAYLKQYASLEGHQQEFDTWILPLCATVPQAQA